VGALPWLTLSFPVSRQSRLGTLVFQGKTGGFAVDVVGFELVWAIIEAKGRRMDPVILLPDLKNAPSLGKPYLG
jgi:hypothetical protein